MFSMKFDGGRKALALAAVLALGVSMPAQAQLFKFPSTESAPAAQQAGQGDAAQLVVRVQQLEEQLRSVNGQVEGLTFQLTQMQELLTSTTQAYEARLKALEGGSSAPTPAQPASTPQPQAVPETEIPPQGVQPLPGEAEFDPTFDDGSAPAGDLGNSADPLVGTGAAGGVDLATGQPIDLNYNPQSASSGDADADAQFAAGADALASGDYAFAEDQFSQFLSLYPDNPQAQDAANLLGEALLQRQAYNEAADVLLKAYQQKTDSDVAPELLLKLGVSLAGVGERDVACRTLAQVDANYPDLEPEISARLAREKANASCPPA
ncbi:tetratricopeptide repeat protein [Devosia submarina]|uniref:tetratricopeptide repeat protein n=1 Tax=Devosia submarina TaxID=1173082 RepID=UPI0013004BA4|nr:tetratricopeptide repeat protein [Devosia submarina]